MSAHASRFMAMAGRATLGKVQNTLFGSSSHVMKNHARSFWYMSTSSNETKCMTVTPAKQPCGCCGFHTEGDKDLVEFLTEEINMEKQNEKAPGQLPSVGGFEVSKANGPEVELVKKVKNETVTVKFNVNSSVMEDFDSEENPQTSDMPEMKCRPPFQVLINKGGKTLAVHFSFSQPDDPDATEEDFEQAAIIEQVSILEPGQEWNEKIYSMDADVMDGNLHEKLLTLVEERGITDEFVDALEEFTTAYEHKQYIGLLEQLKDFAASE